MPIDVARARDETPGCRHVAHFNNAGAALMPAPVIEALNEHLELEATRGGYEAHAMAEQKYRTTYVALARLLNCDASEIALVENATRAWDMAFYGFPFKEGQRIVTAMATYASNYLAMIQMARRTGVKIDVVPDDVRGQVHLNELEARLDSDVALVALTHVPTNGGLVNPAEAVGRLTREAGIPYLLDACQSVGQMPLDIQAIGCDFLSATGRKFLRGPRGTGFLYARTSSLELIEPPFIDLHSAVWTGPESYELQPGASRFENWEGYVAGKIALGKAVEYATQWGLENIRTRVDQLASVLRSELDTVDGITVHDKGERKCGIVTFAHDRVDADNIKSWLATLGINVSTSSREYALLDVDARSLPELVRASVHYYNTEEEIGRLAYAVRSLVGA